METISELTIDPDAQERIRMRTEQARSQVGRAGLFAYRALGSLGSRVRRGLGVDDRVRRDRYQKPWLPAWPKLSARPFHDPRALAWTDVLVQEKERIACELDRLIAERHEPGIANYVDPGKDYWKAFYFFSDFKKHEENCARCPETTRILESIPILRTHVCFSGLEPRSEIPVHVGYSNTMLTMHLGLRNCGNAFVNVGGIERPYREGELLLFDDSFIHCARNEGDERRYTLMMSCWHPELRAFERFLLQQLAERVA